MRRLADLLAAGTKVVMAAAMAVMTTIVSVEVVGRYVLNTSIPFSEELSRFCFIWVGFLGASLAMREGGHIAVNLLTDRVGPRAQRALLVVGRALVLALLATVIVVGVFVLPDQWGQQTATLGFSFFWLHLSVPVGAALVVVQLLALPCSPPSR